MLSPTIYKMCTFFSILFVSLVRCLVAVCIWTLVLGYRPKVFVSHVRSPRPRQCPKQYCRWKTLFYGSFIFCCLCIADFFPSFISLLSLFLESFISFCLYFFFIVFATVGCSIMFASLGKRVRKKHFQRVHKRTSTFMVKYTFFAAK